MPQKKEPKKSDEEKAAEKVAKANASLLKACKNDEVSKVEEAIAKGADINFITEKGDQSMAHVAAAFGALDVIRYLHKNGADFTRINAVRSFCDVSERPGPITLLSLCHTLVLRCPPDRSCLARLLNSSLCPLFSVFDAQAKKTPLESAVQIGEENAVKLIEALLAGKPSDEIGKSSADDDLVDIGDGSGDEEAQATDRSTKKGAASKKGDSSAKKQQDATASSAGDASTAAPTPVAASA